MVKVVRKTEVLSVENINKGFKGKLNCIVFYFKVKLLEKRLINTRAEKIKLFYKEVKEEIKHEFSL